MMGRYERKVFILGLDGVCYSVIKRLMQEGLMPEMSRIVKDGSFLSMKAPLPEVSSVSWVTFMTGVNPAKHGIFGFVELDKDSYDFYFPDSRNIKSMTVWDIIGKKGARSIILNIPATYPARPLNGVLTAGFVAIDLEKATYPEEAYRYLSKIGYRMDVDAEKATTDVEAFKKDVETAFEKRQEAFDYFFEKEWDLFIATVTETDRLHHFFFDAISERSHPMHEFLIDFYQRIDRLAGHFYRRIKDRDILFLIMSDHGFFNIKSEVYLNVWLRKEGFLKFKRESPESLKDIEQGTVAFALDPSRIYIHLKGRYPLGKVSHKEYDLIRRQIKDGLFELSKDGQRVVKEVFFKEEIYSGPFLDVAPDIIVLANRGFDLKGSVAKKDIFGMGVFRGGHIRDDALLFINRVAKFDDIDVVDVTPTVLKFMGFEKEARAMDGKILIGE